jgi:hypothetical protein
MAVAFSVAAWNVEHFGKSKRSCGSDGKKESVGKRIERIIQVLKAQDADIIAIFEVCSSVIFQPLVEAMSNYQFYITEGPQLQEILVGIKQGISAFVTQKIEFKSGQTSLRPGVLVTVYHDRQYYPLLFLHLKSLTDAKGFGLRNDMIDRACAFSKKLVDQARKNMKTKNNLNELPPRDAIPPVNYMFMGDLNTMGLDFNSDGRFEVSATREIDELRKRAEASKMRLLSKTGNATWNNGSASQFSPADLDHVVVADHLEFSRFGGKEVLLRGWPECRSSAEIDNWIDDYSDHALLYFEVQAMSNEP